MIAYPYTLELESSDEESATYVLKEKTDQPILTVTVSARINHRIAAPVPPTLTLSIVLDPWTKQVSDTYREIRNRKED